MKNDHFEKLKAEKHFVKELLYPYTITELKTVPRHKINSPHTKRDDTKSDARGIKLQPKIHFRLHQKRKLVEAQPLGKHDLKYHLPFITNYSISTNYQKFSVLFS